jgi:nucleoside-diphosphate-sugar epimerase
MFMKILCAGSGGYIGIPLVAALLGRGHYVVALDRWFFGKYPAPHPKLGIEKNDIRNTDILDIGREALPYDAVIDLAGLSNDLTSDIDPELTRSINIEGGKRLANLACNAGVKRYVYSSSASVYGSGIRPMLTETDECRPLTLYARSKVEVEDHLRSIAGDGFEPVILRNATVFGVAPRMRFDLAVNVMCLRSHKDGVIYVMGGGEQHRPFIHVDDVVRAFVWAVESDNAAGETFNVGTSNHTIAEVAKKVATEFPMARVMQIPDDPDKRSYSCSFEKFNGAKGNDSFIKPTDRGLIKATKQALMDMSDRCRSIDYEVARMAKMLRDGSLKDDETCHTLQYYRSLMSWEKKLNDIRLDGKIL